MDYQTRFTNARAELAEAARSTQGDCDVLLCRVLEFVFSTLPEPTTDLGDLTAKNAARAALMAEWERLRDAYDAQEIVAQSGDKQATALLRSIGEQVRVAYRRLQENAP